MMQAYSEDHFNEWADRGSPTESSARALEFSEAMQSIKTIKPRTKSNYLIKGLLDLGALSVLIGKPNDGKTFFALYLGFHIGAGEPVLGRKVPPIDDYAGPVLYIAGEGGKGIDNRIEALRRTHPDMCAICEKDDLFVLMKVMVDFCGKLDAVALVDAIEMKCADPSLIVVDTLAMAFAGGDENSAKDMGQFIANCNILRARTGAHVMIKRWS